MDLFSALPGFSVHPYYEDFSTPCFDGLHNIIMGGSFISTGNEASVYSRFHFRPHFFQHAGFRLVRQPPNLLVTSDTDAPGPYVGHSYPFRRSTNVTQHELDAQERGRLLSAASMLFSSLPVNSSLTFTALSESLSSIVRSAAAKEGLRLTDCRVVEVGCGPGGLAWLAPELRSYHGIDSDPSFIDWAQKYLKEGDLTSFKIGGEGELLEDVVLPTVQGKACAINFRCADPMCLPAEMQLFDIVLLNDVIDKVASPNALLGRLGGARGLVRPGGILIITSCFQWTEERTPKSLWIGGYKDANGQVLSGADGLVQRMATEFNLIEKIDLPVLWRKSTRQMEGKLFDVFVFRRT